MSENQGEDLWGWDVVSIWGSQREQKEQGLMMPSTPQECPPSPDRAPPSSQTLADGETGSFDPLRGVKKQAWVLEMGVIEGGVGREEAWIVGEE